MTPTIEHQAQAALPDAVKGLIQLEKYSDASLPLEDWQLTEVLDDILMLEYADTPKGEKAGSHVMRRGVLLPVDISRHTWRVGKVVLRGNAVPSNIQVGTHVLFPNDKGIRAANFNGKQEVVFLNADRVFGVCKPIPLPVEAKAKTKKSK